MALELVEFVLRQGALLVQREQAFQLVDLIRIAPGDFGGKRLGFACQAGTDAAGATRDRGQAGIDAAQQEEKEKDDADHQNYAHDVLNPSPSLKGILAKAATRGVAGMHRPSRGFAMCRWTGKETTLSLFFY